MWIIGLLLVGFLVFVLIKPGNIIKRNSDEPLDSLKKRYVSGEITKKEFLEKKEFLKSH